MVAQPVVRVAVAIGLALGLAGSDAAAQGTGVVVDLTRGADADRRTKAWKAIAEAPALETAGDDALADALAGALKPPAAKRGAEAARSARALAGKGQCKDATTAARAAIIELAAAQALGIDVINSVKQARTAELICALAANDESRAFERVASLRRLGQQTTPDGVSAADWARFPELDAEGNVGVAEWAIDAKIPGATIWVDFVEVGPAKATVYLTRGTHVIAAAAGGAVAASIIEVSGWSGVEMLSRLRPPAGGPPPTR